MIIEFYNLDVPHENGGGTISEVAQSLERRYGIISIFTRKIESKFKDYLIKEVLRFREVDMQMIEEWIRNEWREFIIGAGTGIVTKAAQENGRQSFIDTGGYYENMYMQIKFEGEELKFLSDYNIIDRKNFKG